MGPDRVLGVAAVEVVPTSQARKWTGPARADDQVLGPGQPATALPCRPSAARSSPGIEAHAADSGPERGVRTRARHLGSGARRGSARRVIAASHRPHTQR